MSESLFRKMISLLDDALIDVTMSQKFSKDQDKMRAINTIAHARSMQLEVAELMDKIYPEAYCFTEQFDDSAEDVTKCQFSCIHRACCEERALKRLRIEGEITMAIDALPDDNPHSSCPHVTGCMNHQEAYQFHEGKPGYIRVYGVGRIVDDWNLPNKEKIDPRKTWQI